MEEFQIKKYRAQKGSVQESYSIEEFSIRRKEGRKPSVVCRTKDELIFAPLGAFSESEQMLRQLKNVKVTFKAIQSDEVDAEGKPYVNIIKASITHTNPLFAAIAAGGSLFPKAPEVDV